MKKKALNNKKGSALLIAIVIMMVVTMLSLALLLVSYSLFATSNKQKNTEQCKEIAQGISRELEEEITGTSVDFSNYGEMRKALDEGKSPLWFYLRFNLWQSSWPYYNSEERGHTSSYAYRYFSIDGTKDGEKDILGDVTVLMYWESESGAVKGSDEEQNENTQSETTFVILVTCQRGKQKSTIKSTYDIIIEEQADYGGEGEQIIRCTENPNNNTIQTNEKWTFGSPEHQ